MPPRSVGPYRIVSVIGRGGVGTVYRGQHRTTGRLAAVKLLGPAPAIDPTAARRLAREFEVLSTLEHPNVVRVYEAGVVEGYSFLAMELVEGLDLRAYLSPVLDHGPFQPGEPSPLSPLSNSGGAPHPVELGPEAIRALASMMDEPDTEPAAIAPARPAEDGAPSLEREPLPPEVVEALNRPSRILRLRSVLEQVLDGLAYVHRRGFVHRDLKPSNIMVDDARRARLMDFGLVKATNEREDEPLTVTGRVVGTYRYMSPEQAQGREVDPRSDLYSLGVILYELLCGAPPFSARDPVQLWREILHVAPAPVLRANPGAEAGLAAIAGRLLEKDPARRFASASEILAAIGG